MNLKELKEHIQSNGGATLTSDLKIVNNDKGYYVSLKDFECQLRLNNLNLDTIKHYQEQASKHSAFIGCWVDNGVLYLDISKHIKSKRKALKVAKDNYQLAIYDVKHNNSIYLGGD